MLLPVANIDPCGMEEVGASLEYAVLVLWVMEDNGEEALRSKFQFAFPFRFSRVENPSDQCLFCGPDANELANNSVVLHELHLFTNEH